MKCYATTYVISFLIIFPIMETIWHPFFRDMVGPRKKLILPLLGRESRLQIWHGRSLATMSPRLLSDYRSLKIYIPLLHAFSNMFICGSAVTCTLFNVISPGISLSASLPHATENIFCGNIAKQASFFFFYVTLPVYLLIHSVTKTCFMFFR